MADPLKTVMENVDRMMLRPRTEAPRKGCPLRAAEAASSEHLAGMLDGYRKLRDDLDAQNRMVEQYISAQKSSLG